VQVSLQNRRTFDQQRHRFVTGFSKAGPAVEAISHKLKEFDRPPSFFLVGAVFHQSGFDRVRCLNKLSHGMEETDFGGLVVARLH